MSLHTGIEPSQEINVSELNIPTKKYVDDQDKLRLSKSGGTLTGGLSMDDNKITDLETPTANSHAATKKYVDDQAALKLDLAGGQMTGPLGLGNGRLWGVADPTSPTNGANKRYVDNKHALTLLKSGGTMTGEINMGDDKITGLKTPTNDTDASTKKYVDDQIALQKESNYFVFEFKSAANDTWKQAENLTGHMFWTNSRDIKITLLAHVFDDDNSLPSTLPLSYWIYWWSKTGVESNNWSTFWKIKCTKSSVSGSALQSYPVGKSLTINDIKALTIKYRYIHSGSVGNESALHCLIEYV